MRKFMVAMLLLATVPFALAATCNKKNPDCLDERVMSSAKPECKPSPNPPHFVYPSSTALPTGVLK